MFDELLAETCFGIFVFFTWEDMYSVLAATNHQVYPGLEN